MNFSVMINATVKADTIANVDDLALSNMIPIGTVGDMEVTEVVTSIIGHTSKFNGRPVVIVVRDPDSSNEYTTWPGNGKPHCIDVDLGNIWPGENQFSQSTWPETLKELEGHPAHDVLLGIVLDHWEDDREEQED